MYALRSHRGGRGLAALLLIGCSAGCATTGGGEGSAGYDPWEPMNRTFYAVNDSLDKAFLKPTSDLYVYATPEIFREYVYNFFENVGYPWVVVNDVLQGKIEQGFDDTGRFVINSTLGLGGIIDLASGFGLERHDEDLGQTLAVWGLDEGWYTELPLFGPNSMRDIPDLPLSSLTNPLFFVSSTITLPLSLLRIIDQRARLDSSIKIRDETALDPYIFQREAYRQRRNYLIHDGDPPLDELDDLDLLEEEAGL